jgi:hypothetical protein
MNDTLKELIVLVRRFVAEGTKLTAASSTYSESEARSEFIDPLFRLLGWDVANINGLPNRLKEVVREESQVREKSTKRPDYTFRILGQRRFFVEAKKPAVEIRRHKESAFQVRQYGWSAGLSFSVLTNFQTLRIYDTHTAPSATDDADVGLVAEFACTDFVSHFDELLGIIGRAAVAAGNLDARFAAPPTAIPVNRIFLDRINQWRLTFAADLHGRYPALSLVELSDIVQNVINKLIFIRMCEDRGIEGEGRLRAVAGKRDLIELRKLFRQLDERYDTGLFDISRDALQDKYALDAQVFLDVVEELYFPRAPYSFSVLDADFLGRVYELFLTQRLDSVGGALVLREKPAYQDRDVISTPQPIVDEVVRRTIGGLLRQMQPGGPVGFEALTALRVMDVAVGSSRFLIRVFDELVDEAVAHFRASGDTASIYQRAPGDHRLAFVRKREILTQCLYGIDIDYNAVEVARFSLLVKLLEEEDGNSLPAGRGILPNLDGNIVWGNSVVDAAFTHADPQVVELTRPFDWAGLGIERFDAVVGNPPYVKTEEMKLKTPDEFAYYKTQYTTPFKQFDKYFVFLERAVEVLADDGWIGMVIPNKWITIEAGAKLRELLAMDGLVADVVNFGNELVFESRSTYVCLLILSKAAKPHFFYRSVNSYPEWLASATATGFRLATAMITAYGKRSWVLPADAAEAGVLTRLFANSTTLSQVAAVFNGVQTSAEEVYAIQGWTQTGGVITFEKDGRKWTVERAATKPYLIDSSSRVWSYRPVISDALLIFPYDFDANNEAILIPPTTFRARYPLAWKYLSHYKQRLGERDISPPPATPDEFYRFGRHQSLSKAFTHPKIIVSVNQLGDKYGFDSTGISIASGGTAGECAVASPTGGYSLEFLLGLVNQRAIEFYCRKRGSAFRGGYYSRGTAVLNDVPVPKIDFNDAAQKAAHDVITKAVRSLIGASGKREAAVGREQTNIDRKIATLRDEIKAGFNAIFGFTDEPDKLSLPGER